MREWVHVWAMAKESKALHGEWQGSEKSPIRVIAIHCCVCQNRGTEKHLPMSSLTYGVPPFASRVIGCRGPGGMCGSGSTYGLWRKKARRCIGSGRERKRAIYAAS